MSGGMQGFGTGFADGGFGANEIFGLVLLFDGED